MVFLQLAVVSTRMPVEALSPCVGHYLNQVLITLQVLGQQYQVIAFIIFVKLVIARVIGDIDFTAENGLELLVITTLLVEFCDIIVKLLDAKHIAVVSNGHAPHAIGYRLIDQRLDGCHSVKD